MLDLQLADNGGRIVGDEKLLEVVDNHLVHTVWAVAGLDGLSELFAGPNVTYNRLFQTREEPRPILHHGGKAGSSGNVESHPQSLVWDRSVSQSKIYTKALAFNFYFMICRDTLSSPSLFANRAWKHRARLVPVHSTDKKV